VTFTPNREELAWAAGFYDGEGSAGAYRLRNRTSYYVSLRMSIHQIELSPLVRFKAAVNGVGTISEPRAINSGKPIRAWQANSYEEGQAVIAMLWPFLCEPKKKQAENALRKMRKYHFELSGWRRNCQAGQTVNVEVDWP
jgi:hypothetical protein